MFLPFSLAATNPITSATLWPFAVLAICLATIILLVSVVRVHAFFALIFAMLAEKLPGEYGTLPDTAKKERSHWVQAAELTTEGFGNIAAKIGIVIALASVIGTCLVESGGADKIVRRFLALCGTGDLKLPSFMHTLSHEIRRATAYLYIDFFSCPEVPIEGPILDSFCNMMCGNALRTLKIRNGASHLKDAIVSAGT